MSSNNYQIYINKTLQLAETIVIKSSYTAEALNEWVSGVSGYLIPIDRDPTTWKYYLNLAGEYHRIDQVMTVVSMDTLDTIIFNKENLAIHRATARAYAYGTKQYSELVNKFPDQEDLILGILYPTDIQKAIKAEDGTILSYPPGLVEVNEYTLIERVQKWVTHFKQRWNIPLFNYTDELYAATMMGRLYMLLIQCILTERRAACHTSEAHSFHVREYLGSHGYLDVYMDALTLKQSLYFYRNIAYLERHSGTSANFDTLTEHIMTERFIPLAEYTMKHDVSTQAEEIYPEIVFRKRQLNLGIVLPEDNKTSLDQMMIKQIPLALSNGEDIPERTEAIRTTMKNSPSNVVATKMLESSMVDESNSSPWTLGECLFNHWLYLSSQNLYVAYISITNPQTGDKFPLTAKESFVLAMYAFAASIEQPLEKIPLAYASRVQRLPTVANPTTPSVDDIYSIVDHKLIEREVAVTALSKQPTVKTLLSIDAFYLLGVAIDDAVQMQRRLIAWQEHFERRGMVQGMVTRIYADHILALEPEGTLYDTWLSDRNLDFSSFNRNDFEMLYTDIVGQATGVALNPTQSIKELQTLMVQMFTQLSSYGIQVIREINDSSIRKTDWPAVRVGSVNGTLKSHPRIADTGITAIRSSQHQSVHIEVDNDHPAIQANVKTYGRHRVDSDTTLRLSNACHPTAIKIHAELANPGVLLREPPVEVPRAWVPFVGIEYFLRLSQEQLASIADIYTSDMGYKPPGLIPLDRVVIITELPPFDLGDRSEAVSVSIKNTMLGRTWPEN